MCKRDLATWFTYLFSVPYCIVVLRSLLRQNYIKFIAMRKTYVTNCFKWKKKSNLLSELLFQFVIVCKLSGGVLSHLNNSWRSQSMFSFSSLFTLLSKFLFWFSSKNKKEKLFFLTIWLFHSRRQLDLSQKGSYDDDDDDENEKKSIWHFCHDNSSHINTSKLILSEKKERKIELIIMFDVN